MPDSYVPITAGGGTNVDVSEVTTRTQAPTVVERQRIVLADNSDFDETANIYGGEISVSDKEMRILLSAAVHELRLLRSVIQNWTGASAIALDERLSLDERT